MFNTYTELMVMRQKQNQIEKASRDAWKLFEKPHIQAIQKSDLVKTTLQCCEA